MQSSSQIITTNKPTSSVFTGRTSFLSPTNSVKKETINVSDNDKCHIAGKTLKGNPMSRNWTKMTVNFLSKLWKLITNMSTAKKF